MLPNTLPYITQHAAHTNEHAVRYGVPYYPTHSPIQPHKLSHNTNHIVRSKLCHNTKCAVLCYPTPCPILANTLPNILSHFYQTHRPILASTAEYYPTHYPTNKQTVPQHFLYCPILSQYYMMTPMPLVKNDKTILSQ